MLVCSVMWSLLHWSIVFVCLLRFCSRSIAAKNASIVEMYFTFTFCQSQKTFNFNLKEPVPKRHQNRPIFLMRIGLHFLHILYLCGNSRTNAQIYSVGAIWRYCMASPSYNCFNDQCQASLTKHTRGYHCILGIFLFSSTIIFVTIIFVTMIFTILI